MTPDDILRAQANVRALAFSSLFGLIAALAGACAVIATRAQFFDPETQQLLARMAVLSGFLAGSLFVIGGVLVFVSALVFSRQEANKVQQAIRSGGNHGTAAGPQG